MINIHYLYIYIINILGKGLLSVGWVIVLEPNLSDLHRLKC